MESLSPAQGLACYNSVSQLLLQNLYNATSTDTVWCNSGKYNSVGFYSLFVSVAGLIVNTSVHTND